MGRLAAVEIRARREEDVEPLSAAIEASSAVDRWPPHWPEVDGGFRVARFLKSRQELAAFVADDAGRPAGHIALHAAAAPAVVEVATEALRRPPEELAFVARMYVVPDARRNQVASSLLAAAASHAAGDGRLGVLDVWEGLRAAVALYESAGWRRIGTARITFGSGCTSRCVHDGDAITSFVFATDLAGTLEQKPR